MRFFITLVLFFLTSCSSLPLDSANLNGFCLVYKPVTFSAKNDTPETVKQVRENNAVYDELCGVAH